MTMPRRNKSNIVTDTDMTGAVWSEKAGVQFTCSHHRCVCYKGRGLESSTATSFGMIKILTFKKRT